MGEDILTYVVSILVASIGSGGLWTFLDRRKKKTSSIDKLTLGIGHDRIIHLANIYIKRGYITDDEYTTLYKYLYLPYHEAGGNGPVDRKMDQVYDLPDENGYKRSRRKDDDKL